MTKISLVNIDNFIDMYSELLKTYFLDIVELTPDELDVITSQYKEKKVPKG